MNEQSIAVLDSVVISSSEDLMRSLEIDAKALLVDFRRSGWAEMATSIGFASDHVRGQFSITTDNASVAACRPTELRAVVASDAALVDWAGEFANQLFGRIRNRLSTFGLVFEGSVPVVMTGINLVTRRSKRSANRQYRMDAEGIALFITLVVEALHELELVAGGEAPQREGEVQWF